jgi:hypothetical protein
MHLAKGILARLTQTAVLVASPFMSSLAMAQIHVEAGDAGDLPLTAQIVESVPLTGISGTLGAGDKDMYKMRILDGAQVFTAEVSVGGDSQLFLFDSAGRGVLTNDDVDAIFPRSRISSVLPAGEYFLAISEFNNDPLSGVELIFNEPPPNATIGPLDPTAQITGWTLPEGSGFSYQISLTNAAGITRPVQGVPDQSSSLVLFALSVALLQGAKFRSRKQRSVWFSGPA